MATIQLKGLRAIDAEKAIARVWYVLEQRGIASPRIEACRDSGDRININIAFGAQRDADITLRALTEALSVGAEVLAVAEKSA